jgi:NTE family protein
MRAGNSKSDALTPARLSTIPFLRDVGTGALRDVAKEALWYSVPSGCALFEATEPADTIWFVISGSLGAFRPVSEGKQEFIGHIRQGEPVGEFAVLTGEPHANSVYALRDTEVLALERPTFNRLIRRHPNLMANLARTVLFRARQNRRKNTRAEPRVFALINASPSLNLNARAHALKLALNNLGRTAAIITQEADTGDGAWFDQIERDHNYVFLLSETPFGAWANLCRRRADRIWILGRVDSLPAQDLTHKSVSAIEAFQMVDAILVRSAGARGSANTKAWIDATNAQRVLHWRDDDEVSVAHLARTLCASSVGLVLGGGGARAYAHIGAVRAIREAGLNIDFVGGTSMGGVVGACLALGWSDSEIERRIWNGFVQNSPLDDFLLPVVALTGGKKVDKRLNDNFGDVQIEDLLIPFFCVSSNLSQGTLQVHRHGSLAQSLRASIALPGILPPVVWGEDILVDGAVLDNFPVATMRDMHRGPNIGIDVAQEHALNSEDFRHPASFLTWALKHGLKRAPPISELLMCLAKAKARSRTQSVVPDLLILPELDGIELRDWKAFDRAVEAGYLATKRALRAAPPSLG